MLLQGVSALAPEVGAPLPPRLVAGLSAAAAHSLHSASPAEAALLVASLVKLGHAPDAGLLSTLWACTSGRLGQLAARELAMLGWALGRSCPLAVSPPLEWLQEWQEALATAFLPVQQQQQLDQQQQQQNSVDELQQQQQQRRLSQSTSMLPELAQALYGWSKMAPAAPPPGPPRPEA